MTTTWARELEVAQQAAKAAAAVLLEGWGHRPSFEFKSSTTDLVTEYDRRAEAAVLSTLGAAFPEDGIMAEEGGRHRSTTGRTWHVDPLDGTTNFVHGLPLFATSIGLVTDGRPVVGVVAAPAVDWTFHGAEGVGAYLNQQAIRVSAVPELARSLLVTGFPYLRTEPHDNLAEFGAFMRASQGVRRLGSAALDLCFVAAGWLDAFWERHIKSWDLVAGAAIVTAAGGRISDPDRGPFVPDTGCILASNGLVHQAMLDELARVASAQ